MLVLSSSKLAPSPSTTVQPVAVCNGVLVQPVWNLVCVVSTTVLAGLVAQACRNCWAVSDCACAPAAKLSNAAASAHGLRVERRVEVMPDFL
jgi:hypothetical protein